MKRFQVRVTRVLTYDLEVEADSYSQASVAASSLPVPEEYCDRAVWDLPVKRTEAICQLGEPWVYGWSGDSVTNTSLGRPDQYRDETPDLLVFTTAYGHCFSDKDVELLLARISTVVGEVKESWNGAGYTSLSVRLKEPFGKLTAEQVQKIMAPRSP